jgi:hypothetical protein
MRETKVRDYTQICAASLQVLRQVASQRSVA